MSQIVSPIRSVSDTARWVAVYRARETERPDAVFRDPYARRLAGEIGEQIARSMPFAEKNSWPFVARTWLFDQLIDEQVRQGADMVVNLAAGLDARPYRMGLPSSLIWIEVDLPEILAHKAEILADDRPMCALERIPLDLTNVSARREFLSRQSARAERVLIVAEGLLVYLSEEEVTLLGRDLASQTSFQHWIIDLGSPALLRMLTRKMGAPLDQAGAHLKFAPKEGPQFFLRSGWKSQVVHSIVHAAAKLNRAPMFLRIMAKLSSQQFQARRPWSGACLLGKQ